MLQGVKQTYVIFQPDLAVPNAESILRTFIDVARKQGVEHIVLLSGRGEDGAVLTENGAWHFA